MKEILYDGVYRYVGSKRGIIKNLPYPANLIYVAFGEVHETQMADKEFMVNFNQSLQSLTSRQHRVVELRYQNGLTLEAIGTALGISPAAVSCEEKRVLETLHSFDCRSKIMPENKTEQELHNCSIETLPLHSRYVRQLKKAGYLNIKSICQDYNNGSLSSVKGFGKRGMSAVKRSLNKLSLI